MCKKFNVKAMISVLLIAVLMLSVFGCAKQQSTPAQDANQKAEAPKAEAPKAETWKPERPVSIVVFAGAGGAADLGARGLAKAYEEYFGVPFQVVNMPGGAGGVAANHVWNQKHDGYTLFGTTSGVHSLNVIGAFDQTNDKWDFQLAMETPGILSVSANSPYKTLEDLVAAGKTKQLKSSASSAGCVWDLKVSQLEKLSDIKINHMPYEGSQPSMVAALSGEVDFTLTGMAEQREYILAKKLIPLAVIEKEAANIEGFGEVKSISELYSEFKDLPSPMVWIGLGIPGDTPENIKKAYSDAFEIAMKSDTMKKLAGDTKYELLGIQGEEAAKIVKEQDSIYSWSMYDLGSATKSPEEFNIPRP